MCPRGVAPERVLKAEATELAPKNRPMPLRFRRGLGGAFVLVDFLVEFPSRGLEQINAKTVGLLSPGVPFSISIA
jgi:hypothetical protein